jgi:hypothetical protein
VSLPDKIRAIAKATLDEADISNASYEGADVKAYDDPNANAPQSKSMWDPVFIKAPKGALDVTLTYHLPEIPGSDEAEAKFAEELFQKVFGLSPSVWLVTVAFVGPDVDRYGHNKEHTYLAYGMPRTTFSKIDWRGFEAAGLCRFLMDEAHDDVAVDGEPTGDNLCDLNPATSSLNIPRQRSP